MNESLQDQAQKNLVKLAELSIDGFDDLIDKEDGEEALVEEEQDKSSSSSRSWTQVEGSSSRTNVYNNNDKDQLAHQSEEYDDVNETALVQQSTQQKSLKVQSSQFVEDVNMVDVTKGGGFIQLVQVGSEEQNLQIVAKLLMDREQVHGLCNQIAPGSSKNQGTSIDFLLLNKQVAKIVGVCGTQESIIRYFTEHLKADHQHFQDMPAGIYLWKGESDIFCLVVWPVPDFLLKPSRSSAYTSLLRYVVELCSDVVYLFNDEEIKTFQPNMRQTQKKFAKGGKSYKLGKHTDQEADVKIIGQSFSDDLCYDQIIRHNSKFLECSLEKTSNMAIIVLKWQLPLEKVFLDDTQTLKDTDVRTTFQNLTDQFQIELDDRIFRQLSGDSVSEASTCSGTWLIQNTVPELGERITVILKKAGIIQQDNEAKLNNIPHHISLQNEQTVKQFSILYEQLFDLVLTSHGTMDEQTFDEQYDKIAGVLKELYPRINEQLLSSGTMKDYVDKMIQIRANAQTIKESLQYCIKEQYQCLTVDQIQIKTFKHFMDNSKILVCWDILERRTEREWNPKLTNPFEMTKNKFVGDYELKDFMDILKQGQRERAERIVYNKEEFLQVKDTTKLLLVEEVVQLFEKYQQERFRQQKREFEKAYKYPVLKSSPIKEEIEEIITQFREIVRGRQEEENQENKLQLFVKNVTVRQGDRRFATVQTRQQKLKQGDVHYVVRTYQVVKSSNADITCAPSTVAQFKREQSDRCLLIAPLTDGTLKLLYVFANDKECFIYVVSKQSGLTQNSNKKHIRIMIDQATYDPFNRALCLLSKKDKSVTVYLFDKEYQNLETLFTIALGTSLRDDEDLHSICLIPCTKELLVYVGTTVRIFELKSQSFQAYNLLKYPDDGLQRYFIPTPDGSLLVEVLYYNDSWSYAVYTLKRQSSSPAFTKIRSATPIHDFSDIQPKDAGFWIVELHQQSFLVACSKVGKQVVVRSVKLTITSLLQRNILTQVNRGKDNFSKLVNPDQQQSPVNALLDYLYHIFDKFPAKAILDTVFSLNAKNLIIMLNRSEGLNGEEIKEHMISFIKDIWNSLPKNTGKNFDDVQFPCEIEVGWKHISECSQQVLTTQQMGDFITKLILLVPIQICRCEGNTLLPLSDGKPLVIDQDITNIEEVIDSISFGLYDSIFAFYNYPTVVVSSMGSQSVGKSYQLNHIGGCLFDVSGERCTDGCWMTIRPSVDASGSNFLVVFLDFEGLGSWERTEQEDMMLSLMSAAITHLTMFKTHFVFDRYTLQTLKRFNLGAAKVKNMCGDSGKNLFTGTFMFCLKDVQIQAAQEAENAFEEKVLEVVQEEDNFLAQMYNGELEIFTFPSIADRDFYDRLQEAAEITILDADWLAAKNLQQSRSFCSLLKTLIAKIAHKDWTPVNRTRIRSRVELLTKHLQNAWANGVIKQQNDTIDLINYDTHSLIAVEPTIMVDMSGEIFAEFIQAMKTVPNYKHLIQQDQAYFLSFPIADADVYVGETEGGGIDRGSVVQKLRQKMRQYLPPEMNSFVNSPQEHRLLNLFIQAALERRKGCIEKWLTENMSAFLDDPEAKTLFHVHNLHFNSVSQQLKLCTHSCDCCFQKCFQTLNHEGAHSCLSDHKCYAQCEFCTSFAIKGCVDKAGHVGKHTCGSPEHTCGAQCDLAQSTWNCGQTCQLLPGHEGGHMCASTTHYCKEMCQLQVCKERCTIPHDVQHDRHQCATIGCPIPCVLCNKKCSSSDHFHGASDDVVHLCEDEHTCVDPNTKMANQCSHLGWCEIRPELHREKRTFHGKRGDFEYEHVTDQIKKRHMCVIKIPAGQLKHAGPCSHSLDPNVLHYCGEPCASCHYRCTKPHGHPGKHSTQHGNMRNTIFVADAEDIDIGDRKYARGESGEAETCDSFCVKMGRGHAHTIHCVKQKCQNAFFPEHRHAQAQYQTDGSNPLELDELTHEAYFDHIGFEDPCLPEQQALFKKCGVKCGSVSHAQEKDSDGNKVVRYCQLPVWHEPLQPADPLPGGRTTGYISQKGHFFECVHGRFSTYLIIDRSGSMSSRSAVPVSQEIQAHRYFRGVNNCLGAVYECALKYVKLRAYSSPDDLVTFVPFHHSSSVVFSNWSVSQHQQILDSMMSITPGGDTAFVSGLASAYNELAKERRQGGNSLTRKPVFILLTDSGAGDIQRTIDYLNDIMAKEASQPSPLCIQALGVGQYVNENFLQNIAKIGNGSYRKMNGENDVPMGLEMSDVFTALAEQPDINVGILTIR